MPSVDVDPGPEEQKVSERDELAVRSFRYFAESAWPYLDEAPPWSLSIDGACDDIDEYLALSEIASLRAQPGPGPLRIRVVREAHKPIGLCLAAWRRLHPHRGEMPGVGIPKTTGKTSLEKSTWYRRVLGYSKATLSRGRPDVPWLQGVLRTVAHTRTTRDQEFRRLDEIEEEKLKARDDLMAFILYTHNNYLAGWFHRRLCNALEWFERELRAGNSPRLIIEAPPRAGKTEVVSRYFPVWYLGRNPWHEIICASYGKDLADDNSRDAREIARGEQTGDVFPELMPKVAKKRHQVDYKRSDVDRADNWRVGTKGRYRSAGVCTGISGKGAHVFIIDDPFKDRQEADSQARRELVKKWFTSTATTRLAPHSGVVLMATRWHEMDLTGMVRDAEKHGGDKWVVLSFPAVAEKNEYEAGQPWDAWSEPEDPENPWDSLPEDERPPLLRSTGEALHPERFDLERLEKIQAAMQSLGRLRDWDALYQQRPIAEGGNQIKREWFDERYSCPAKDIALQADEVWLSVDAAKKGKAHNDFHVMQLWSLTGNKRHLLDRVAGQMGYPEFEKAMDGLILKWSPILREKGGALIEDTANGATYIQVRGPSHHGVVLIDFSPTRDTPGRDSSKPARASYLVRAAESRGIILPDSNECPWVEDVIAWWCAFPLGSHDDDVDAASQLMMRWTIDEAEPESFFTLFG